MQRSLNIFTVCILWILQYTVLNAQIPRTKNKPVDTNSTQPNIILIYIDDLGYSDLACYGNEFGADFIETPQIDRLATQSIKFTHAYAAAPLCSPSRAAILTGKTPARLNFEFVTKWEKDRYSSKDPAWVSQFNKFKTVPPPYTLNLPLKEKTIAEVLKTAGYTTGIAGKWHVSSHFNTYNGWNPDYGPAQQGFDWTADVTGGWAKNNGPARAKAAQGEFPADALTDQAIHFIRQKHNGPFFLYLSHYYVHTPVDAELKWLVGKYKLKAAGRDVSDKHIRYAAFVETLDHYVGQFLRALEEEGLMQNTLIVLTSDNGGMPEYTYNSPFRGSKWNLFEGGIRIPMLVKMPGHRVDATVCDEPVMQTDLLPTFYKLATGKRFNDTTIDGADISGLLSGQIGSIPERPLIWHFPYYHPEGKSFDTARAQIGIADGVVSQTRPQSAIRMGRYKLMYYHETGNTELYDLQNDRAEQSDISKKNPGTNKRLKAELLNYLAKVNARFPAKHNSYLKSNVRK